MKNLVLFSFLAVLIYGSSMIYRYKDIVFYWDFAKSAGEISFEPDAELDQAVERYLAENNTDARTRCIHQSFGRDELFIYAKILCDEFLKEGTTVRMVGHGFPQPVRFEYDPMKKSVVAMEKPKSLEFAELRSLLPKPVYSFMRWSDFPSQELLLKGYELQQRPAAPGEAESSSELETEP